MSIAAAPAADGAAIEVPFRYIIRRLSTGLTPASRCGFLPDEQVVDRLRIDQLVARGDEIGLDEVVVMFDALGIRPVAACRAARTVGGNAVVAARVCPEAVRGTHRDDRRGVAGRVDSAVDFPPVAVLPVVAGRGHYDDSCVNQTTDGEQSGSFL
jgi:hypothetical protein